MLLTNSHIDPELCKFLFFFTNTSIFLSLFTSQKQIPYQNLIMSDIDINTSLNLNKQKINIMGKNQVDLIVQEADLHKKNLQSNQQKIIYELNFFAKRYQIIPKLKYVIQIFINQIINLIFCGCFSKSYLSIKNTNM